QAKMRKKGQFSISDNFFDDSVVKNEVWKENLGLLDSELSMHLKFAMEPGPLFVKKESFSASEYTAFEAFKTEVNAKLAEMQ
ncbi:hypothetical protein A2U01_0090758, partial [Trifolium medium]|nr:hypothetical protein [Trifolium medium]